MVLDENTNNITEEKEEEYANLLQQEQFKDKTQQSQTPKSDPVTFIKNDKIDTPEKEREAADKLHKKQVLGAIQTGVGLTKYRGSKGHSALSAAATGARTLEEGGSLGGATKDIALSEAKRRIIRSALSKLGLSTVVLRVKTIGQARNIARQLNEQVPEHRTAVYIFVITLAATKDLVDIFSIEILSLFDWTLDLMILILFFFLLGKGTLKIRIARRAIKVALLVAGSLEMIPLIGLIPMWTICTLYAYFQESKRVEEYKEQIEKVNEAVDYEV